MPSCPIQSGQAGHGPFSPAQGFDAGKCANDGISRRLPISGPGEDGRKVEFSTLTPSCRNHFPTSRAAASPSRALCHRRPVPFHAQMRDHAWVLSTNSAQHFEFTGCAEIPIDRILPHPRSNWGKSPLIPRASSMNQRLSVGAAKPSDKSCPTHNALKAKPASPTAAAGCIAGLGDRFARRIFLQLHRLQQPVPASIVEQTHELAQGRRAFGHQRGIGAAPHDLFRAVGEEQPALPQTQRGEGELLQRLGRGGEAPLA